MTADRERGAAAVLVVAALGVLLTVLVAGVALSSAVAATHRARAGADLAALAAARQIQQGSDPTTACAVGRVVAAANGVSASGCLVAGDGSVTYRATTVASFRLPGVGRDSTTATARAGPSP